MEKTALLLIDIQNIYFAEGNYRLHEPEAAASNAKALLRCCREQGLPVVHIRHRFAGCGPDLNDIHADVYPAPGEPVLEKTTPNAFFSTGLADLLEGRGIRHLVVAGMMSHMCVDTSVRAARDHGLRCTLAHDACAAPDLSFGGAEYGAETVHAVFMAALSGGFAEVLRCDEVLNRLQER